jgi:hypothetical protein
MDLAQPGVLAEGIFGASRTSTHAIVGIRLTTISLSPKINLLACPEDMKTTRSSQFPRPSEL